MKGAGHKALTLEVRGLRFEAVKKECAWSSLCLQPQAKVREADLSAPPTSDFILYAPCSMPYAFPHLTSRFIE